MWSVSCEIQKVVENYTLSDVLNAVIDIRGNAEIEFRLKLAYDKAVCRSAINQ